MFSAFSKIPFACVPASETPPSGCTRSLAGAAMLGVYTPVASVIKSVGWSKPVSHVLLVFAGNAGLCIG